MKLKDRKLSVGDRVIYQSALVNGTGYTFADCVITDVVDEEKKMYKLKRIDELGKEEDNYSWGEIEVQDIDDVYERELHGKDVFPLTWLITQKEYESISLANGDTL